VYKVTGILNSFKEVVVISPTAVDEAASAPSSLTSTNALWIREFIIL